MNCSRTPDVSKRVKSGQLRTRPNLMRRVTKALPLLTAGEDKVQAGVMQGNMEELPPVNSRVVRIFLSSTFSGECQKLRIRD